MLDACIHVVGLGVSGFTHDDKPLLTQDAQDAIKTADKIIGSPRQLALIRPFLTTASPQLIELPKLAALAELLGDHQTCKMVVLASGDPLYYGIGRWLVNMLGRENLIFHAGISSIQAACHALGLSLQDVSAVSLHGRPLAKLRTQLHPEHTLVILTDKNSRPKALAQECINAGMGSSIITVCENMGYPEQQVRQFQVAELVDESELEFAELHVSVVQVKADKLDAKLRYLPDFPGIEDIHFITGQAAGKGMITKREVRLQILSLMQPAKGDVIWDVGAGCGSVAVELAYWQQSATVHAIEHHEQRLACLQGNKDKFGVVSNLVITAGRAPDALAELPQANKVFIGGSDGEMARLLSICWQQLPVGGVLVATAVTENTKFELQRFSQQLYAHSSHEFTPSSDTASDSELNVEIETLQLAVSRGSKLAGQLMYKPNFPVTLFKFTKLA